MRTNDPNVLLQTMMRVQGSPILIPAKQYEGVYYGIVHQNETTSASIPSGQISVVISALSPDTVWGPMPYPGSAIPPVGTICVVAFTVDNNAIVLSLVNFGGAQGPQGPQGTGGTNSYWGGFYDTTSQTGSVTSVNLVAIHNTAFGNGITLLNPGSTTFGTNAATAGSAVQIQNAGNYTLTYQVMFANSGSQIGNADLWIRLNGVDIPTTNLYTTVPGAHSGTNGTAMGIATFNVPANAGDYYQLCWAPSSSSISIYAVPAQTGPTVPAGDSVLFAIQQIAFSGPQGVQGYQGIQGYQGNQGPQGYQSSVQGYQGNNGSNGAQGAQGYQGTQGFQGYQGVAGSNGTNGSQGYQGYQGNAGTNGTNGTQGAQGYQGVAGTNGTNGSQGSQGYQGYQGNAGTNGTNGSQGPQGYQGIAGTNGTNGSQGAQGYQGYQGNAGTNGTNGSQGAQGYQGYQGNAGTNGTNGSQGNQGYQGYQGATPSSYVSSFSAGTTGFSPSTATTGDIVLTGVLNVANGGLNTSTAPTKGAIPVGSSNTAYTPLSVGATGSIFITSGANPLPSWLAIGATGAVLYSNNATIPAWSSGPVGATGSVLSILGNVPTWSTVGSTGQILVSQGIASTPTWASIGSKVTSYISAAGGGSTTPVNVTNVSLTTGTWLIQAQAVVKYSTATSTVELWLGPNSASGTSAYTSGAATVVSTDTVQTVSITTIQSFVSTTSVYFNSVGTAGYTIVQSSPVNGYAANTTTGIVAVRIA